VIHAAGIDLGGTKIEASVFDAGWAVLETRRVPTPGNYAALIDALADQVNWLQQHSAKTSVGVGAPGRHDSKTGLAFMANVAADGHPMRADLKAATKTNISFGNDCDLFALSEAKLGAGQGFDTVFGLILGTGIGGGICLNGALHQTPNNTAGEVGHLPISASLVQEFDLPILQCGCGRHGCYETLGAGPGLSRLAEMLSGQTIQAQEIAARNGKEMHIWTRIIAELIGALQLTIDPDCIVLGGGLSNIPDVDQILTKAIENAGLRGAYPPKISKAAFGDSSGTRGAALLAFKERMAQT